MALFGGQVRTTGYQAPDYSGSIDAARGLAMTRAQGVASGINQVTDYFKQQGEKKKLIKQSDVQIDAALKLFPDLSPTLQGVRDQIKDENISLDERAQIAETVAGLINMGTNQMQSMAIAGLKKRELDIQEGKGIQEALARQAELKAKASAESRKAPVLAEIPVPGGTQTVQWDPDTQSYKTPTVVLPDGVVDEGVTPMDIPTVEGVFIPANEGVVSEDGQTVDYLGKTYTIDPGVLQPLNSGSGIQNAISLGKPTATSQIGFLPSETKSTREAKVVSGNEAKALNLDPAGTYEVTYENGKAVGYKTITAPSTEIGRAQLSKLEAESKEAKDKIEKAQRARDIALKTMSDYVTDKGEPTKRLNNAVGYGEAVATTIAEYAPIFGTQSPESRSDQQRLARLIEGEILEAASLLKPVSNTDLLMLKDNRPQTTSPPEVWAKYFSDIKTILSNPENYIESVPTPKTEAAKESVTPKTATDQLRAMQK
jgi:hypothetical protein